MPMFYIIPFGLLLIIDYNAIILAYQIAKLQSVQNATARFVYMVPKFTGSTITQVRVSLYLAMEQFEFVASRLWNYTRLPIEQGMLPGRKK